MYTVNITVMVKGPLFDGRAKTVLHDYTKRVVEVVAKTGRNDLGVQFIKVFKDPTGFYESRVRAEPVSDFWLIHDSRVPYGPWLEGVGSRNYPVTRFKGYHSFQLVTKQLVKKAGPIAQHELIPYLAKIGGHKS